jgi:hypothetical protein
MPVMDDTPCRRASRFAGTRRDLVALSWFYRTDGGGIMATPVPELKPARQER